MPVTFLNAKQTGLFGDWSRICQLDGNTYHVSVRRGRSVRIAFKPRGQNRGWHWHGSVYSNGKCLWAGRVDKSIGARGLLIQAGVIQPLTE
jgi:hypothetical protein